MMLIVYLQAITNKRLNKKHYFQDENYKGKIKRPIKSCLSLISAS
jgi:hypothetical protein